MACADRAADSSLTTSLEKERRPLSFFQMVQLLERHAPSAARVGREGPASAEGIRFRASPSMAFPASDVADVRSVDSVDGIPRFQVTTTFLGLYGVTSPLPTYFTEEILWKDPDDNPVRAFLDLLFHHRFISLIYRCWVKYRYHTQFEAGGNDAFSKRMLALVGLGTPGMTERMAIPPVRLIRYAGLMTQQLHSASTLSGILEDLFYGVPVQIEQCTGRWTAIPSPQRMVLGRSALGTNSLLGGKVYTRNSSFKIILGPLTYEVFCRFLPGGTDFQMITELTLIFVGKRLDFDLELQILGREIPRLQLTFAKSASENAGQTRLGWTTWVYSKSSDEVRSKERSVTVRS